MQASENLDQLAPALCRAQAAMRGALKDSTNPHFKSRYADLASVWDACRDALTANGLSVVQLPGGNGAAVEMTTMLLHASGQWISCTGTFTAVKSDPQAIGSAITYARRYQLAAVVGVAPEDDDGNAASGTGERPAPKPEPKPEAKPKPSAPKLAPELAGLLSAFGWPGADRARNADTLLALVGYTLAQCQHSEEAARDAFAALDAKLSEFVGTNDEKLAALWRAAQYGGVDL
jgi:hypothetical protein